MKRVSQLVAHRAVSGCSALIGLSLFTTSAWANLIIDPSFETPNANPTDVNLPTSQAGAALNPTFPWYDLLTNAGDQAEISSDIPVFAANPPVPGPSNRINAGTGKTGGAGGTGGNSANSGDQYDYAFTVGRPAGTVGGVAQLVTGIIPGDLYVGSAFFFVKTNGGNPDGDRFQLNGSTDSVQMIFQDALGTQIGPTVFSTIGGNAGFADSTVPQNVWIQLSTAPTAAPAGASQVVFELALTRGASGGVQFGDDASLEDKSVPEPASLGLVAAALVLLPTRRRS